ncbi:MAG: trigger factor [Lachnospiraceae bacterium]|nr:trigger factor [Robinsoniella sp.]MDY3765746.1 trigger factor [Lachnospiraceae bacterium]
MKKKMMAVFCLAAIGLSGCASKPLENEYVKLSSSYKGIEVEMEKSEVSDEELQDEIAFQMEINGEAREITDRPAQIGDTVVIDFEGTIDGEEFDGGTGYGYTIVLGDGTFLEEFENGIVGMKTNESKDVHVKFPDDYNVEVAGKEAIFNITVYSIQEVTVPEYTDEFVESISGYTTRKEYEKALREELEEMNEENARGMAVDEILWKLVSEAEFKKIPEELYESCKAEKERENQYEEELFGMTLEDMGLTEEDVAADIDYMVRERLVMELIADAEKIEVTQEECDEYIAYNMDYYGFNTADEMEEVYGSDGIRAVVLKEKIGDVLIKNAKITEVDKKTDDFFLATAGDV